MTREQEFRRRWYEAHRNRFVADEAAHEDALVERGRIEASAPAALALLAELQTTGDIDAFVSQMRVWARSEGENFQGLHGAGYLNALMKRSDEPSRLADVLAQSLSVPGSDEDALTKIRAFGDYVTEIQQKGRPALARVPLHLSYFWALADSNRWPIMWRSSADFLQHLTGEKPPADNAERYSRFAERIRELSGDIREVEMTAQWWDHEWPVFLDEVLMERAAFGHSGDASTEALEDNARALVRIAKNWGESLVEEVSEALGHELAYKAPSSLEWKPGVPRGDVWIDWYSERVPGMGMRVWINRQGAAVALRPGLIRKGWRVEVAPLFESADYAGCRVLGGESSMIGENVGLGGINWAEFVYGRWFQREEISEVDLASTIVDVATLLKPMYDEMLSLALGQAHDPLEPIVKQYLAESGYPTSEDEDHRAKREEFAALLAPEVRFGRESLRDIWQSGRFGGTGSMSILNRSLNEADEQEFDRMVDAIRYLCWGDEPDAERIDRMLDPEDLKTKGLGESVIMKLLAITHPETFIPAFPYHGAKGKGLMIHCLGLEEPTGSPGEMQVRANQILRDRVEPFFPDDPWGMSKFLYWYLDRNDKGSELDKLAGELLIDRSFLEDIEELLKDKRQVILYGPPGTGKTYLAREFAKTLAPDRHTIVQFHPSSSYEDFFEGYRPEEDEDGSLTYRLKPGPLERMADKARANPDQIYIMIIDEINRANLPKVLGELLYLFEYRDEPVQTLYRPDDGFTLPPNLWFIGTMNTADRSIALVDAALRRRFHFVPFFPDRWPIEDLLQRWLEAKGEPTWVAELVAQVNDELKDELGGSHLLLGPSYFMKENLDEQAVRRIWEYNIEPFIEDQFFDNHEQIDKFRFKTALQRYRKESGVEETEELAVEESEVSDSDDDADSDGEMQ